MFMKSSSLSSSSLEKRFMLLGHNQDGDIINILSDYRQHYLTEDPCRVTVSAHL